MMFSLRGAAGHGAEQHSCVSGAVPPFLVVCLHLQKFRGFPPSSRWVETEVFLHAVRPKMHLEYVKFASTILLLARWASWKVFEDKFALGFFFLS